jgi:protein TonB
LRPVPKPEAPKPVVAKPEPQLKPVPKPEPRLKPVPVPVPPKPKDVVLKPVPKVELPKEPSLKPVPVAKPTPIVATPPVRAALVSQPIASTSAPGPSNPAMNAAGTGPGSGSGTGSGVPGGTGTGGGSGGADAISGFHQNVKDSYFSQWQQPRGLTLSGAKYRVRTEIVIDRAGRISSARIVTTSGNAEMDQSVREAVGRVNKVAPLPKGIDGETYALILNFDI